MFEHPQSIYDAITAERARVDRANELRRIIAENPTRIVRRQHPFLARFHGWLRRERADAAARPIESDSPRGSCDPAARAAHAR